MAENLGAGDAIQLTGRLVGQDQLGPLEDRAGNRDPLLLAAGKLVWAMVEPPPQPHVFQELNGPCAEVAPDAPRHVRNEHVVDRRQVGQQIEALKDEADFLPSVLVPLRRREFLQSPAAHHDLPAAWLIETPIR